MNAYAKALRIINVTWLGLAFDLSSNQFSRATVFDHMCLLQIKQTKNHLR